MASQRPGLFLATCLVLTLTTVVPAAPESPPLDAASMDELLLRREGIGDDVPSLLTFFRKRTLNATDQKRLTDWVRQLGSASYREREEASSELVQRGPAALPYLEAARTDRDLEIVRRAERCREAISRGPGPALPGAAVRTLVRRGPPGAVSALLDYLPFADDDTVEEEILAGLAALPKHPEADHGLLIAALKDARPKRRGAAAHVLGRFPDAGLRSQVLPLLRDPDALVRLWAARGLLAGGEKVAVVALIDLLASAPPEQTYVAEEVLATVAGPWLPPIGLTENTPDARKTYRDAWAAWWRENENNVDLTRVEARPQALGLTLIAQMDRQRVWECNREGKQLWSIEGLGGPIDARVLTNGNVLIAEFQAHRVTERDRAGKIIWEKRVTNPVVCQRLPSGNTFIASYTHLLEVTPRGEEVYNMRPTQAHIYGAQRLRNGQVVCVTLGGEVIIVEPTKGRTVRTLKLETGNCYSVELLPGGNFLVTNYNNNRVQEFDTAGKMRWDREVQGAYHATRLVNGNTLVSSHGGKRVVELSRGGEVVWTVDAGGYVWRVHRR